MLSKHLYKQDWESVFKKLHFCIDLMTILVSHQAAPPTFCNKIAPVYTKRCAWTLCRLRTVCKEDKFQVLNFNKMKIARRAAKQLNQRLA